MSWKKENFIGLIKIWKSITWIDIPKSSHLKAQYQMYTEVKREARGKTKTRVWLSAYKVKRSMCKYQTWLYTSIKIPISGQSTPGKEFYGHYVWYGRYCLYLLKSIDRLLISSGIFQGKRKWFTGKLKCILRFNFVGKSSKTKPWNWL